MSVAVVLLAAGYATRLLPLTADRPKALLPLGDGVILDEVRRSLETVADLSRTLLVTNHRFAEQFRDWQRSRRAAIDIVDDGTETPETRLGAIRDLALAAREAPAAEDLLVVGTDNLFRWALGDFAKAAQRCRPAPSLALWQAPSREAATSFGVVVREASGRVTAFAEKSLRPPSTEVALCVYYFPAPMRPEIQRFLTAGRNTDAPGYFIEWLVGCRPVYGIMMPGPWYDIGSQEAYDEVVRVWQHAGDR
jgi:glucose-1-phosphate thymidylyltransferase